MPLANAPDRYVSFKGIDFEGNTQKVIDMLRPHLDNPENDNPFYGKLSEYLDRVEQGLPINGKKMDKLFFIHCYMNNLRDIFENVGDNEGLQMLEKVEQECC